MIIRTNLLLAVLLIFFLTGCNFLTSSAAEPPRPTIVPAKPSATSGTTPVTDSEQAKPTLEAVAATPVEPLVSEQTPTDLPSTAEPVSSTAAPIAPTPPATVVARPALDSLALRLTPLAEGLTRPLYLTHAGDGSGRLFVVEQAGRILLFKDGAVLPTPFLDIISLVGSEANEQGLLSVAFHPDYTRNGLLFVNYTNKQGDTVIARYRVSDNPDVADGNSGQILLTIDQPYANHNGGQLNFGPDGYLYVGMGDGGAANDPENNAQTLSSLLGKILRLDVAKGEPYGVPETNPFVGNDQARPEIWSYGWRNPWRFSFDRATGDLYVADVGQNQYEEVHVEMAGEAGGRNYGWRLMEGFHCFNPSDCDPETLDLELPVVEYDHSQGCSITGGYVYRGQQYPALAGVYLYGDYCSGLIWGLRLEPDGSWSQAELLQTDHTISSFGEDQSGELYLIDHTGRVLEIGL